MSPCVHLLLAPSIHSTYTRGAFQSSQDPVPFCLTPCRSSLVLRGQSLDSPRWCSVPPQPVTAIHRDSAIRLGGPACCPSSAPCAPAPAPAGSAPCWAATSPSLLPTGPVPSPSSEAAPRAQGPSPLVPLSQACADLCVFVLPYGIFMCICFLSKL